MTHDELCDMAARCQLAKDRGGGTVDAASVVPLVKEIVTMWTALDQIVALKVKGPFRGAGSPAGFHRNQLLRAIEIARKALESK